jgi:hypothetical protein
MVEFAIILIAGLGSAVLGAGFGWIIGTTTPELIELLFANATNDEPVVAPVQVATALGAISGLVLGAGAMAVGLLASAIRSRKA